MPRAKLTKDQRHIKQLEETIGRLQPHVEALAVADEAKLKRINEMIDVHQQDVQLIAELRADLDRAWAKAQANADRADTLACEVASLTGCLRSLRVDAAVVAHAHGDLAQSLVNADDALKSVDDAHHRREIHTLSQRYRDDRRRAERQGTNVAEAIAIREKVAEQMSGKTGSSPSTRIHHIPGDFRSAQAWEDHISAEGPDTACATFDQGDFYQGRAMETGTDTPTKE